MPTSISQAGLNRGKGSAVRIVFNLFFCMLSIFCFLPSILPLLSLVSVPWQHKEKLLYYPRSTESMKCHSRFCASQLTHMTFLQSVVYFAYFICEVKVKFAQRRPIFRNSKQGCGLYIYRVCTLHYFDVGMSKDLIFLK